MDALGYLKILNWHEGDGPRYVDELGLFNVGLR